MEEDDSQNHEFPSLWDDELMLDDSQLLSCLDEKDLFNVESGSPENNKETPKLPNKKRRRRGPVKKCPDFKKIPGTKFIVDGFQFKSDEYPFYFLSHYHSDHYIGLTKTFDFGKIYCSEITASLVLDIHRVSPEYVVPLEMNKKYEIDGNEVILLEANHCPGAVLFLFCIQGKYYLHTGDFRYHPSMKSYPELQNIKIQGLFLDNTFCDPKYVFPKQEKAIQDIVEIVRDQGKEDVLFLVGTYLIGKERVLIAIAKQLGKKIFVSIRKYGILQHLKIDTSIFTTDPSETNVHVVSMGQVNFRSMKEFLSCSKTKYTRAIGIQPTGWAFGKSINKLAKRNSGSCTIYGVPYSEHSNYDELKAFVKWIDPIEIIPTVNCSTPEKVNSILAHFNRKEQSSTLLNFFQRSSEKIRGIISCFSSEKIESPLKQEEIESESKSTVIKEAKPTEENASPSKVPLLIDIESEDDEVCIVEETFQSNSQQIRKKSSFSTAFSYSSTKTKKKKQKVSKTSPKSTEKTVQEDTNQTKIFSFLKTKQTKPQTRIA